MTNVKLIPIKSNHIMTYELFTIFSGPEALDTKEDERKSLKQSKTIDRHFMKNSRNTDGQKLK